jgi:hypothetical protein
VPECCCDGAAGLQLRSANPAARWLSKRHWYRMCCHVFKSDASNKRNGAPCKVHRQYASLPQQYRRSATRTLPRLPPRISPHGPAASLRYNHAASSPAMSLATSAGGRCADRTAMNVCAALSTCTEHTLDISIIVPSVVQRFVSWQIRATMRVFVPESRMHERNRKLHLPQAAAPGLGVIRLQALQIHAGAEHRRLVAPRRRIKQPAALGAGLRHAQHLAALRRVHAADHHRAQCPAAAQHTE